MAAAQWNNPPAMQIDPAKTYLVTIETVRGSIELELYPQYAPKTVNNFVFLTQEGFYDGITFHRVIDNFMVQGGDPTGSDHSLTHRFTRCNGHRISLSRWRVSGRTRSR